MTAFIDALKPLMPDTVTWAALTGRDQYAKPTYGSGTTFTARVVRQHKLVRDAAGDQIVSTAHAWLAGSPAISPQDKVTLSDGTSPPIITIERFPDESGPSHTKVYFR